MDCIPPYILTPTTTWVTYGMHSAVIDDAGHHGAFLSGLERFWGKGKGEGEWGEKVLGKRERGGKVLEGGQRVGKVF